MIYIIYKTNEDLNKAKIQLSIASKYIYKEDLSEKVTNSIKFISYDDISNESFKNNLNKTPLNYMEVEDELYYKFFDLNIKENDEEAFKTAYQLVVCLNSGNQNTEPFSLFHNTLLKEYFNEMCDIEDHNILDDITELGLYAFANNYETNKDNDLIYTFLYNKKKMKTVFEDIMGEGTYDEYDNYCRMVEYDYYLNNENVSYYEFGKIMEGLKKYFYKKIDTLDIPLDDRNAMIIRFNHKYRDVYNKQIEHQKNRINKKSGI